MSPLNYRPRLPPRGEHRVIDKQGVDWIARYDGLSLRPESYDWRVLFTRPGATETVAYVEPGTSLEHEAFLRDILAEAEPARPLTEIRSGNLYDFVQEVVARRVEWSCAEKVFGRRVIRLDPERVDVKIEFTDHVFPAHIDTLQEVLESALKQIPVWRQALKGE